MAFWINILYSICLIYISCIGLLLCDDCPDECSCLPQNRVICDDRSLKKVPENLPPKTSSLVILGTRRKPFSIPRLKRLDFKNIPDLTELFINLGGVERIDPDAFADLKQLKRLDLKLNKITKIYASTFDGLDNLELINLSGNEGCNLQTGAVAKLPNLRDLYLSDLRMRSLDASSFIGLDSLRHLDLSGNSLRTFDKDVLEPLKTLTSLDITSNRLKALDESMKTSLSKLDSLKLGNNPWQCNCDMQWFKQLPIQFIYDSSAFNEDRVVICNGPSKLRYKSLKDTPDKELSCIKPTIKDCYDVKEKMGKSATITCNISGDPFPDITWTLPDKSIVKSTKEASGYTFQDKGALLIKSMNFVHNGTWHISVKNKLGDDQDIVTVNVELAPYAPTIKDCQDVTGLESKEARIECTIKGYPFPNITWTLPHKSKIYSFSKLNTSMYDILDNGTLLIKSLMTSDDGRWKIYVENENGSDTASVLIKVQTFVPKIKDCKEVTEDEGRQAQIECDITGYPFPDITWILPDKSQLHSRDLTHNSNKYGFVNGIGTLIIKVLDSKQDGSWQVIVKNKFGMDSTFVKVKVMSDPAPADNKGLIIGAAAGGGVALICLITIISVCCKNKKNSVGDIGEDSGRKVGK